MDNDDAPIGKVLSRREAIATLGGTGLAAVVGGVLLGSSDRASATTVAQTKPAVAKPQGLIVPCVLVSPEQTEGPFFVDERLNRSDIRGEPGSTKFRPGVPLELVFNLIQVSKKCTALQGAMVDIWHCDASGIYSDVRQNGTNGQKFIRGYQVSDEKGQVKFQTIYPGWYRGRTVHIHFKIRHSVGEKFHEFTSQLYFDDHLTDQVHATSSYLANGQRDLRNSQDGIYGQGGNKLMLALAKTTTGYQGTFDVGLIF